MAVLKMQRLGICAWKKNRKQILELLQRRGVLDIDTDAAEDEVFKKTDTSEARGDFERDIQLIEHALEILQLAPAGIWKIRPRYTITNSAGIIKTAAIITFAKKTEEKYCPASSFSFR